MSFRMAIWAMEQEQKALKWLRDDSSSGSPKRMSDLSPAEQVFVSTAGTGWVIAHSYVAAQPYAQMFGYAAKEDRFLRELALHSARSSGGMGVSLGFRWGVGIKGFQTKFMTATAGRKLAAKAASRFIPYAGWALLALDLWHVGKWIGEQTS